MVEIVKVIQGEITCERHRAEGDKVCTRRRCECQESYCYQFELHVRPAAMSLPVRQCDALLPPSRCF